MIEIGKDFSVNVTFGEEEQLVNRVFDHVHLFRPIGHSIVKLVTTEGFQQWHLPIETGERVAEAAGIVPTERTEITEREYDGYLRFQESTLDDTWLD
jgi:hypothetical protein